MPSCKQFDKDINTGAYFYCYKIGYLKKNYPNINVSIVNKVDKEHEKHNTKLYNRIYPRAAE